VAVDRELMANAGWRWTVALAAAAVAVSPASAREYQDISIPAGRLDRAIMLLGQQAGVSIALADPSLGSFQVPAITGRMDAASALRRLLGKSRLDVVVVDSKNYRIIRARRAAPRRARPQSRPPLAQKPVAPDPPPPVVEVVVTASKRDLNISDYPGSVSILSLDDRFGGSPGLHGTNAIVQKLPILNSTNLGPGRNKLFIRGVADSSFTGLTQATVGQYLGDARLNYNAPDPALDLYDIGEVEVLEGPQGTLYGAGSLGGVIRLSPRAPDSDAVSATLRAGASQTYHGADSYDLAGMVNLPVSRDLVGLRLVGYNSMDGGYIQDSRRGLSNINFSKISGGRAALRITPGDGWTIDAGLVAQDIHNRDGQYTEADLPKLTHASRIAQPFDNDYILGYITVDKNWGGLSLKSTSAMIQQNLINRFDASILGGGTPIAFDQDLEIRQKSNETRLSQRNANGHGWVIGFNVSNGFDLVLRKLGDPSDPPILSHVNNEHTEIAGFGEWSFGLSEHLSASLGGRFSYARFASEVADPDLTVPPELQRKLKHFVPMASLSWKPQANWLVYTRYQEGFRAGGLSLIGIDTAAYFDSDTLSTIELGTRFGEAHHDRLSASLVASYARWKSIQADLIDVQGFPYTDNIGNGRIWALSLSARWRPISSLIFDAAAFFNQSNLTNEAPGIALTGEDELPNIARVGAHFSLGWTHELGGDARLTLGGNARYVGRSFLGVGDLLDIPQGRYVDTGLTLHIEQGNMGLTLGVTNLFNAVRNRFSFGNPFGAMDRNQQTPLRPRTIRIALDAKL
jgi:iron complex outermembrane recepter protein